MDLSALIFVALAVAWAVYLIPKALKHHEEDQRSRTVDRFSMSMRVVARREPVDSRTARLVVPAQAAVGVTAPPAGSSSPPSAPAPASSSSSSSSSASGREATRGAARRRRRVLAVLVLATVTVTALAVLSVVDPVYVAIPVVLLVAWLVACRLMVRSERAARTSVVRPPATRREPGPVAERDPVDPAAGEAGPVTEEIAAVVEHSVEHSAAPATGSWDPVPVTLPTYVSKETAGRRSVRTIDLDSTGVWTSGHDESDSRLAREAGAADRSTPPLSTEEAARRASGA